MTPTKIACPECGRVRGVRWRERAKTFLCSLCSHTWTPPDGTENAIGRSETGDLPPDESQVPAAPSLNGASHPCRTCGLSHRNTVHTNKAQFGYHAHVEVPE